MNYKTVTCLSCGWVAFEVSRQHALDEVRRFTEYYLNLEPSIQEQFYGNRPASMHDYECCQLCGGSHKNYRDSKYGDCPDGVTMSPIISREE